jgi:hypothetical protein
MEGIDSTRARARKLGSEDCGVKKQPSIPVMHLVDKVVGDKEAIEDDAENVSSSVNAPSSQPIKVQKKRKSLYADLPVGSEGPSRRNLPRSRAQSDQRETFKSQKVRLDDFRLIQTIGKGGFGKVLKVQLDSFHEDRGNTFAMKILRKQVCYENFLFPRQSNGSSHSHTFPTHTHYN